MRAAAEAAASTLEPHIGYRFADPDLLLTALTHRSWCSENEGSASNERLEFLGDSVLDLAVAQRLYADEADLDEGQMSRVRAAVVNRVTLAAVGREIQLGPLMRLGYGEHTSGGRDTPSILADAVEAVIGAVYLDGGIGMACGVVYGLLSGRISAAARQPDMSDAKTRLQELAAKVGLGSPRYKIESTGPAHRPRHEATVSVGTAAGTGVGSSKKEAMQLAAAEACGVLQSLRAEQALSERPAAQTQHSLERE